VVYKNFVRDNVKKKSISTKKYKSVKRKLKKNCVGKKNILKQRSFLPMGCFLFGNVEFLKDINSG